MGKQHWKAGNMLNPVPAVMVSVSDGNGKKKYNYSCIGRNYMH